MKHEPEFDLFRVDPSWYQKYWFGNKPIKPTWTQRLLGLIAVFRQRADKATAVRQAPVGAARDLDVRKLGDVLSAQGNVSHS